MNEEYIRMRGTTIIAVRRNGEVAMAGDGQITIGDIVVKHTAKKIRTLYHDQVLAGFAGAVADALTLFERFEGQLEKHGGNLRRAAVELAREWRTDRFLRHLEASLIVADPHQLLTLSGSGEVIEPDEPIVSIGSGGAYAQSAALALVKHTDLSAAVIARESLNIASRICIYTNQHITLLELPVNPASATPSDQTGNL